MYKLKHLYLLVIIIVFASSKSYGENIPLKEAYSYENYLEIINYINPKDYSKEDIKVYEKIIKANKIGKNSSREEIDFAISNILSGQSKLKGKNITYSNDFHLNSYDDFNNGVYHNLKLDKKMGQGSLVLKNNETYGYYISPIIETPAFEYMVISWNSHTPPSSSIEVEARALVEHFDENSQASTSWTQWFSWGEWSPFIGRFSKSSSGDLAKISTDQFIVSGSKGETASKVQIRVKFYSKEKKASPSLSLIHGSLKNTINPIEKTFTDPMDLEDLDKVLDVPTYSQMIRNPSTSRAICSPTSISMILNSKGEDLLPDEVAQNTYDNSYGFGNWTFATASAGSFGYESFVEFTNIEGLKREIAKGYPVAVSVKYTNNPNNTKLPYLEGAPGDTPGHIIVVKGFTRINGLEYVLVNDSYGEDDSKVSRSYKLDQFEKSWSNRVAYIVRDKVNNQKIYPMARLESELVASQSIGQYDLKYNNEIIDLSNFDGVIAYSYDGGGNYLYIKNGNTSSISLPKEHVSSPDFKLYVISDMGYIYTVK